jgi:hypothetical protein
MVLRYLTEGYPSLCLIVSVLTSRIKDYFDKGFEFLSEQTNELGSY